MTSLVVRMSALNAAVRAEGGIEAVLLTRLELAPLAAAVVELWHLNRAWEVVLDDGVEGVTTTGGQRAWMERWLGSTGSRFNGSGRQRGKSLFHLACLDHGARQWAGSKGRWCGLTAETAHGIVTQAYNDYFLTCPTALKPQWSSGDLLYFNDSIVHVVGTDAKSFRTARGQGRISIDVRDEYGFYQRPLEVDAALDAGLTVPGPSGLPGRVLYSTTPSDSPSHESNAVAEAHQARDAFELETLYDNPRADPEQTIRDIMGKTGQSREEVIQSTSFRREYLGERVVEERRAAVPRWSKMCGPEATKHALVVDLPRPAYFDAYEALDPGRKVDPHAALLAWFDFERQLLYFEREIELPSVRHTVADIAGALKQLEREAFGANAWDGTLLGAEEWREKYGELPDYLQAAFSERAPKQPLLRVGDNDDLVLNTLANEHGLAIFPTEKQDKHLAVDAFNELVGRGQVKVHPRCVRLRAQLNGTIWNEQRTAWVRTALDHGDLLDCAIYIARNVFWHRDPRPKPPQWGQDAAAPSPYEKLTALRRRLV